MYTETMAAVDVHVRESNAMKNGSVSVVQYVLAEDHTNLS